MDDREEEWWQLSRQAEVHRCWIEDVQRGAGKRERDDLDHLIWIELGGGAARRKKLSPAE